MSITSTVIDHAETQFIEAADVLRPFVGCFWVVTAERDATIRVVPDASTAISIELQASRASGWCLRGPLVRPQERRFTSATTLIGVRLRPGVAFLVSRKRADAMVGRRVRLGGRDFRSLSLGSGLLQTPAEHVDVLQRFLIERLNGAAVHRVVARALDEIQRADGSIRVGDVAAPCGVSQRHLNRLMHSWVGYGPKVLGRIVRFQATLRQIEKAPSRSGAAVATDAGYFDQAHLALDMTRMAGATPRHVASRCVADFYKTRCDGPL